MDMRALWLAGGLPSSAPRGWRAGAADRPSGRTSLRQLRNRDLSRNRSCLLRSKPGPVAHDWRVEAVEKRDELFRFRPGHEERPDTLVEIACAPVAAAIVITHDLAQRTHPAVMHDV